MFYPFQTVNGTEVEKPWAGIAFSPVLQQKSQGFLEFSFGGWAAYKTDPIYLGSVNLDLGQTGEL